MKGLNTAWRIRLGAVGWFLGGLALPVGGAGSVAGLAAAACDRRAAGGPDLRLRLLHPVPSRAGAPWGGVNLTKAAWPHMREKGYGRVIFTTSSSGLYGNFGQSNYGAAKMALVGLMQTVALEGEKASIRVNCLAPSAATQMTEGLYSEHDLKGLSTDLVSPGVVALASEAAPTRTILLAGAGA